MTKEINWESFAHTIVDRLEKCNKKYYVKDDLKKHLNKAPLLCYAE